MPRCNVLYIIVLIVILLPFKTPNMFINEPPHPHPHPTPTAIAQHCEAYVGFYALKLSSTNFHLSSAKFHQTFSFGNHMISSKTTNDKGLFSVMECICKIETWLRSCDTEDYFITFSQDASDKTAFKRRYVLKTIIGTSLHT